MSVSRKIPTVHDDWIVALDSLRLALPIDTSLEARSSELRNPEGPARSCVVHQSNAIIGAVTTGYECLPPSCDGLTGPNDHGPMISWLIDRGIEATCYVFPVDRLA
ncbi:BTB/POZ domain-containing protein-like [Dorcoceras hygrometricum]|uniref:BTB/POZ domain-containing protein-like n=1 Tax=Dorcoceras hygrometricum TaxID=472368 RepID=A0A2Z7CG47_9LAMI|nr:BTB/POZ domain-containing protein-like [Dorcoceras hygrometricum]